MYEESLRTPILMRYPKEIEKGTQVNELIQNLDFAPTFLDYAGLDIPENLQGESFINIVNKTSSEWRDAIYYTYYEYPSVHMAKRHYGIVNKEFKLSHFYYDVYEWELYDRINDPNEMNNVYNNPDYQDVVKKLTTELKEMRIKYKDSEELDRSFIYD